MKIKTILAIAKLCGINEDEAKMDVVHNEYNVYDDQYRVMIKLAEDKENDSTGNLYGDRNWDGCKPTKLTLKCFDFKTNSYTVDCDLMTFLLMRDFL